MPLIGIAALLAGCGGGSNGGGPANGAPPAPPVATSGPCPSGPVRELTYATSEPLVDNSGAGAYKILLLGNSHSSGLRDTLRDLLRLGQQGKQIDVELAPGSGFLIDRLDDGQTAETLACQQWTHVVLQAQKYSTSGALTYPTDAAEHWIRGAKELGATPILFPEHPRAGNDWEGQTLWDLHSGIAVRENACVAPVGLVWDEVIFRQPDLVLHRPDGNHASDTGMLLTSLVFYQVITGEPVESLPDLTSFGVDAGTQQDMIDAVSSLLFTFPPCAFD